MNLQNGAEVARTCPKCGVAHRLVVRTNGKDGSQFLGCPNYPRCRHTEPIPEDIRMRAMGQRRLL